MKKTMRFLSMAALALVGAMMTGCSSDDDILQPENKTNVVTLTTTVSLDGGATTRAVTSTGVKTFAVGETMAIYYWKDKGNVHEKAVSAPLTAGDITNGGKSATFTFTLDNPYKDMSVSYVYPAAMVNADFTPNYDALYNNQDGTLATLASNFDFCTSSGAWVGGNLPSLTLENQLAILAINLKNGSTDITSTITGMTLGDGTNTYSVTREAAAGPIYVAIRPTTGATINVTATDGTYEYVKTLSGKTYDDGNGYNVTWNMTKLTKVTWNSTNVFNEANQDDVLDDWNKTPLTYEGITISLSGTYGSNFYPYSTADDKNAVLVCYGDDGDSFTFTAPSGKKFTNIEIINNSSMEFDAYGDWTNPAAHKIVWRGTAANAVTLGTVYTNASKLNSIEFTLKDE